MKTRIERSPLPDPATFRRMISERAEGMIEGAKLVDADAQGFTGFDLILADDEGRPIFVDIVTDSVGEIPSRAFEHLEWLERNKRLFLKAYSRDGIVRTEEPIFVFLAPKFPSGTVRAIGSMRGVTVKLVRAECVLVDGAGDILLEEISSTEEQPAAMIPAGAGGRGGQADSALDVKIESESVRRLLALFRSGVDGLDGRISERDWNGGTVFELSGHPLAHVTVSPVSFTVSPGDRAGNPIVVSDRVSLERALNAVVSLFVREGRPAEGEAGSRAGSGGPVDRENPDLAGIWGGGIVRASK
jgi:hypothetical protein